MRTYAWRRLDTPGLELATCRRLADGAVLGGCHHFAARADVDGDGFPLTYERLWQRT